MPSVPRHSNGQKDSQLIPYLVMNPSQQGTAHVGNNNYFDFDVFLLFQFLQ